MDDNLLQQFLPDDSESLRKAIMAAGLGMLGTRKGFETAGIGRAGLLGMGVYERDQQNQMEENIKKLAIAKAIAMEQQQRAAAQQQMESSAALRQGLGIGGSQGFSSPAQGPPADFRVPGGAGALMTGAAMGVLPQTKQLPTQAPAGGPAGAPDYAARLNAWASVLERHFLETGNEASRIQAEKYRAEALKAQEEYATEIQKVLDAKGNLTGVVMGKRGTALQVPGTPFVAPTLHSTGGALTRFSGVTGESLGVAAPMTPTPGETLADVRARQQQGLAERRFQFEQNQALAGGGPTAKAATDVRKEVAALPQVKAYFEVLPVLMSARESVSQNTKAADLNLIYAAAKIFDPGSVVRESETTMVMGTGSPAQRFMGMWNQVLGGAGLTPQTRANLMQQIESRARGYESNYKAVRKLYEPLLKKSNIDPADVFIEPSVTPEAYVAPVSTDIRARADAIISGGR